MKRTSTVLSLTQNGETYEYFVTFHEKHSKGNVELTVLMTCQERRIFTTDSSSRCWTSSEIERNIYREIQVSRYQNGRLRPSAVNVEMPIKEFFLLLS